MSTLGSRGGTALAAVLADLDVDRLVVAVADHRAVPLGPVPATA